MSGQYPPGYPPPPPGWTYAPAQQPQPTYAPPPGPGGPTAVISMPTAAQMGGEQPLPFVRFPFYPTAPYYSTNPNVGYQVRFYSTGLLRTDADYATNSEAIRSVQFDIPCRLIAINGAAIDATQVIAYDSTTMNLQYLFRAEYTTGDKLTVTARLASNVVGTMENPGEIGSHGYNIDQGGTMLIGLTPLVANLRIDITLVCLEMRPPRNFSITR